MGQDCCTNRFKTKIYSGSRSSVDTTSAFVQTTFNPFKNSLSISFLYIQTGQQVVIQNSLKTILELAEQCSKNHICCYFDPDYLQKQHSLIEYQSPGSSFNRNNLADVFWTDLEYFYEEDICNEIFQFKVILLIETQGKGKHALSITRCNDPSRGNYFIVYDFLNRNRTYREKVFQDEDSLNGYLNTIGEHFFVSYSPQPLSMKLLTFQQIDDKTESDVENLVNNINSSQLTGNNNNLNIINISQSLHSQQQILQQQQLSSSNSASIQQQQQHSQTGNIIPLHIQLQSLPSGQGKMCPKVGSISSIRSFQSLNQQGVSIPINLHRNLSQNAQSEQVGQSIQQQQNAQGTSQNLNQQYVIQLKQLNQNSEQNAHLPTPPEIIQSNNIRCSSTEHHYFFSNNNNNSQSTGIPVSKCSCGFKQNVNIHQIDQMLIDQSWEQENGQGENAIEFCTKDEMNYDQNIQDLDLLENGQCLQAQFKNDNQILHQADEGQTPHHSFHFQNNAIILCGASHDHEDFLSDDASEIQICIQSANDLD